MARRKSNKFGKSKANRKPKAENNQDPKQPSVCLESKPKNMRRSRKDLWVESKAKQQKPFHLGKKLDRALQSIGSSISLFIFTYIRMPGSFRLHFKGFMALCLSLYGWMVSFYSLLKTQMRKSFRHLGINTGWMKPAKKHYRRNGKLRPKHAKY